MVYKLFVSLIGSMAIAINPWSMNRVRANPTEYIFSAPPEVDSELIEIPVSETDYPLYECNSESSDAETETALDSHNCEDLAEDTESDSKITSQDKQEQE